MRADTAVARMSFRLVQMYLFQFAVHQGGHVEAITAHSFEYDASSPL